MCVCGSNYEQHGGVQLYPCAAGAIPQLVAARRTALRCLLRDILAEWHLLADPLVAIIE